MKTVSVSCQINDLPCTETVTQTHIAWTFRKSNKQEIKQKKVLVDHNSFTLKLPCQFVGLC